MSNQVTYHADIVAIQEKLGKLDLGTGVVTEMELESIPTKGSENVRPRKGQYKQVVHS